MTVLIVVGVYGTDPRTRSMTVLYDQYVLVFMNRREHYAGIRVLCIQKGGGGWT